MWIIEPVVRCQLVAATKREPAVETWHLTNRTLAMCVSNFYFFYYFCIYLFISLFICLVNTIIGLTYLLLVAHPIPISHVPRLVTSLTCQEYSATWRMDGPPPNKLYYSKKNLQNLKIIKLPNKMQTPTNYKLGQ